MKKSILLFLAVLMGVPVTAQIKLQSAGTITGYTKLYTSELRQMVGRYPVYFGQTDMDRLRLGMYATFSLPSTRLLLRPEASYVGHSIWVGAENPFHDPNDPEEFWISSGSPHTYNRLEVASSLVWQNRFWYLQAGPAGWYRFADPFYRNYSDSRPSRAIFPALDRAFNPWVGAVKVGAGLRIGRFHLEANYLRNITRVLHSQLTADQQTTRLGQLRVASVTYDVRFDVFRQREKQ